LDHEVEKELKRQNSFFQFRTADRREFFLNFNASIDIRRSQLLEIDPVNSLKRIFFIPICSQSMTFHFSIIFHIRFTNTFLDNTKSNQIKVIKTPGGVLRAQHTKKRGTTPKCGDCGISLPGVVALRPREFSRAKKSDKSVSRPYGGSRCGNCVKERIIRAFLIEEQKIVQKVLKEQAEKEKQAEQN